MLQKVVYTIPLVQPAIGGACNTKAIVLTKEVQHCQVASFGCFDTEQ